MVKAVTFFLIAVLILGIFGKLRFPGQKRLQAARCKTCGRYRIGRVGCDCERKS